MKIIKVFLLAATSFFAVNAQAQLTDTLTCPTITLTGPEGKMSESKPATFTASYVWADGSERPVDRNSLSYNWLVADATIISGQGTPSISVDAKGLKGKTIIVTIILGGLERKCPSDKSMRVKIVK